MTNNELIQALKLCLTQNKCCFGCSMADNGTSDVGECQEELAKTTIDFINQQGEEIERLNGVLQNKTDISNAIKIEAVETFANMIEKKMVQMCRDEDIHIPYPFTFIDELLKEYSESLEENSDT